MGKWGVRVVIFRANDFIIENGWGQTRPSTRYSRRDRPCTPSQDSTAYLPGILSLQVQDSTALAWSASSLWPSLQLSPLVTPRIFPGALSVVPFQCFSLKQNSTPTVSIHVPLYWHHAATSIIKSPIRHMISLHQSNAVHAAPSGPRLLTEPFGRRAASTTPPSSNTFTQLIGQ